MSITVKYFASLAEKLNKTEEALAFKEGMTVLEVWDTLNPEQKILTNTICSINLEYSTLDQVVIDQSEVAFFPPVTGG